MPVVRYAAGWLRWVQASLMVSLRVSCSRAQSATKNYGIGNWARMVGKSTSACVLFVYVSKYIWCLSTLWVG